MFKYASPFINKIQILVNSLDRSQRQRPRWLRQNNETNSLVDVLAQEDFFEEDKKVCLPTFNSLTIENQIFNTKSEVDKVGSPPCLRLWLLIEIRMFVLSDDMLLTTEHAASDIYSPLFGPTVGFKSNVYNIIGAPVVEKTQRFGEKPFLIYSSWLLNRRFGERKRKGQVHFGHSVSRNVAKEVSESFPRPTLKSASRRFRGENGPKGELGFQLYSWHSMFHYIIERQREALLWSYIALRSDTGSNGLLSWSERQIILSELEEGIGYEGSTTHRDRNFFHIQCCTPPRVSAHLNHTPKRFGPHTMGVSQSRALSAQSTM